MGRGRSGIIEQSLKKPKIKNKHRGGDLQIFQPHLKQEKFTLPLLSEGLLAEMKQMNPQNLMNILLPNNVNRDISSQFIQRNATLLYRPKIWLVYQITANLPSTHTKT